MKKLSWILLLLAWIPVTDVSAFASKNGDKVVQLVTDSSDDGAQEEVRGMEDVSDPLEPLNRAVFWFNDSLYFGLLKPVSSVYSKVVPEPVRMGVRNFFNNLAEPQYFLGAVLQGKVQQSGIEVSRFFINTLLGGVGLVDVAERFGLKGGDEDMGQVLGHYGVGGGPYLVWPVLGPSTFRDSIGLAGDIALNPLTYEPSEFWTRAGVFSYKIANETSLHLGEYEDFKKSAFDPYVALRNAYLQKRAAQIQN